MSESLEELTNDELESRIYEWIGWAGPRTKSPRWAADVGAAISVLNFLHGWGVAITRQAATSFNDKAHHDKRAYRVELCSNDGRRAFKMDQSLPRAICLAALAAQGAK